MKPLPPQVKGLVSGRDIGVANKHAGNSPKKERMGYCYVDIDTGLADVGQLQGAFQTEVC